MQNQEQKKMVGGGREQADRKAELREAAVEI